MNNYFTSTIFRKILAALSGLFLTLFLFGHLAGNLQLFISGVEGQTQFNKYALFMTTNPAVKLLSILTYSSILLHVILTLYLAFKSRQARPIGYAVSSGNSNSSWSSNNMAILGTFLLLFIIVHMRSFWYEMHLLSHVIYIYNRGVHALAAARPCYIYIYIYHNMSFCWQRAAAQIQHSGIPAKRDTSVIPHS